jgi:cell surface protein SprA
LRQFFYLYILSAFIFVLLSHDLSSANLPDPYSPLSAVVLPDTIPIKERYGDFITDEQNNPFDLMPSNITQEIEYDPETDRYYIMEKVGDEYYRTPSYMSFDEYVQWKSKKQETEYFQRLAGIETKGGVKVRDPMLSLDQNFDASDRLFGGTEINITPQGTVELTLGFDYQRRADPALPVRQQRQLFIPDFRMNPRLSVDGGIGEKLNLGFNYDAQSTFDFDRRIKLDYNSEAFSEDDIIKKIEAGNVNLPLQSNLIRGVESLFGLKMETQFGRLRLTGLASQQRSRQNNIQIENGASVTEFEITPDEYDENRHFFLSHWHRNNYEDALKFMPAIVTSHMAVQIEVWISDDRPDYQDGSTMICAVADFAKGESANLDNPMMPFPPPPPMAQPNFLRDAQGEVLPDNRVNRLFSEIINNTEAKQIDRTSTVLSTQYNLTQTRDFEVFRGRLLNSSEYTFHPQLGTLSLNMRLRPNQVLGVAYKYYYTLNGDSVYTVGQMAFEGLDSSQSDPEAEATPPSVVFVKMLKSSNQVTTVPSWDLMMKNVYNLRTAQLNSEGFEFDIFYEDDFDDGSLKKFMPVEGLRNFPLLQIFNLDRLNRFNDPQPDGIFDYVPGVTVVERSGSVVFPVLEPFGSSLKKNFEELAPGIDPEPFLYQELYDTTIVIARQSLEKNKFIMMGRVKAEASGDIPLGPFVPRGSVRVSAGGVLLQEGVDYEIDYGLGRLRIINPAYLSQGTPINVSFEDNATFSLQQKVMLGLRAEYAFKKNITLGATYLRLFERPFSQKVNVGDDPINNRIFGLDLNYSGEAPFITRMLDKLPFFSTKEMSHVNFTGEVAVLAPGTSSAVNVPGESEAVVSIDDFEGAITGFVLGGFNTDVWVLSSTPPEFPEHNLDNDVNYGTNRALFNWYQLDRSARRRDDNMDPYTRLIEQTELFQRQVEIGQTEMFTFDLSYWPNERGPYNFDRPGGTQYSAGLVYDNMEQKFYLDRPETRWGGIMRYFPNNDFEAANFEFIDFWVLNPFMDRRDGSSHGFMEEGEMVFHLGNVSEDVLRDGLQFYENALPVGETNLPVVRNNWGKAAVNVPVVDGFDRQRGKEQDLGFDGINDDDERTLHAQWLQDLAAVAGSVPPDILNDPANDNFLFFGDPALSGEDNLLVRMKRFNSPQGNAPLDNSQQFQTFQRGNRLPDTEDLNNNRSLDRGETHYEYRLKFRNAGGEIDTAANRFYRQKRVIVANGKEEIWYRFQVPLSQYDKNTGLTGFRSIQFMRLYMTGFETQKVFRMADFQLVRSQWRRSDNQCEGDQVPGDIVFAIDRVGVEENSNKLPFNYRTPPGIKQERFFGTFSNLLQDERAMALVFSNLFPKCRFGVNKIMRLDMTLYDRIQMFVHAEDSEEHVIPDGDLRLYMRVGKDMVNNYYEYEIPLNMSNRDFPSHADSIWLKENFIDVHLDKFREVKKLKLQTGEEEMPDPDKPGAIIRIKGVPSLGLVKVIEVGIRNVSADPGIVHEGEIWINELRLVGLSRKGGMAGQARAQIKLADLGELNLSGNFSTIGWGGLDQRLMERERQSVAQYDIATSLQLGRFFPESIPLNIPFYYQFSKSIIKPQFDPYQRDLTVDEMLAITEDPIERQDIIDRARETITARSFNFTNVQYTGGQGKMPWALNNFNFTYANNNIVRSNPIILSDRENQEILSIDYNYALKSKGIQPLKFIKSKSLRILSEFNFNPLPSRLAFNTEMNRFRNERTFRLPVTPVFRFDDLRFKWVRNYTLDWDLTKSIRINYRANSMSIVDELRQVGIADDPADRGWVNEFGEDFTQRVTDEPRLPNQYRNDNIMRLGRSRNFTQRISGQYRLPFALIPILDWINITAEYTAEYNWVGGPLIVIDELGNMPGNIISNTQNRAMNATLSFDKLYAKSKYLKKIETPARPTRGGGRTGAAPPARRSSRQDAQEEEKKKEKTPGKIERALIRPLLSLRNIRMAYKEDFGTLIPGFSPQAGLLGMEPGFAAPGWGFVMGIQPDMERNNPNNWLFANQDWFVQSPLLNEQIAQNRRKNMNAKIMIEPVKDFVVDVDFIKNFRIDNTQIFKFRDDQFEQMAFYDMGGLDVTFFTMNTLFENTQAVYDRFKRNREVISNQRLPNRPGAGQHQSHPNYSEGYGPTSYAVSVPAFLAAYTGVEATDVGTDIINDISRYSYIPRPNWNLRYNGLTKLSMFKDILSSFNLRHGYRSVLTVARFNSAPDFNPNDPFGRVAPGSFNYYSRLEVPAMSIAEQFNPLIGIDLKTKKNLNLNFEYKKSRMLDLRLNANELSETVASEIVVGFGYVIPNFKGLGGGGKKKRTRPRKDEEEDETKPAAQTPKPPGRGRGAQGSLKDLIININIGVRDDKNSIYRLENESDPEPRRGQQSIMINPNVEYIMYENLTLRFFVDYQSTEPYATTQFPITNMRGGVMARFILK